MLSRNDLARVDWGALDADLASAAARRGLEFREGNRILRQEYERPQKGAHTIIGGDFRATEANLSDLDTDSQTLARAADAVALVRRFLADEQSGRPADTTPVSAPAAPGIFARAIASISSIATLTGANPRKGGAA